jgi:hypothetical protein
MHLSTSSYFYSGEFQIDWTASAGSMMYRLERWDSLYAFLGLKLFHDFNMLSWTEGLIIDTTKGIPFETVDKATFKVISIDSSWGQLYSPERSFGAFPYFTEWWQNQTETSITKRSNIQGPNVVGVFGSYNQTKRITFYMKGIR